jgi:hypothetical protein
MMGIFWGVCYVAATFNVWLVGTIAEMNGNDFLWGFVYITVVSASMFIGSFTLPETGPGASRLCREVASENSDRAGGE